MLSRSQRPGSGRAPPWELNCSIKFYPNFEEIRIYIKKRTDTFIDYDKIDRFVFWTKGLNKREYFKSFGSFWPWEIIFMSHRVIASLIGRAILWLISFVSKSQFRDFSKNERTKFWPWKAAIEKWVPKHLPKISRKIWNIDSINLIPLNYFFILE